ncbi:hypothetical protein LCGC14_1139370 [marine sediment metagenome]|uniref:Uncharacterized protein n=1 Tax=marine sediment metagenome TaxID=412755 RepID=A0A0F9PGZ0_9ZZZZ
MADTWRVVSQRQTSDITPDGRFVDIMEVSVETVTGTTITVRIPTDQYSADAARAMIESRVADVLAVEEL